MTESTVDQYAASTNGRVLVEGDAPEDPPQIPHGRSVLTIVVPIILIVVALVVLRRMQQGNYA